jgi:hypothetical protein
VIETSHPAILEAVGQPPVVRLTRIVEPGMAGVARRLGEGRRVAAVPVDRGLTDLGGEHFR